jgi:hypothetical protein
LGNIFKMILKVIRWSKLPTFTVPVLAQRPCHGRGPGFEPRPGTLVKSLHSTVLLIPFVLRSVLSRPRSAPQRRATISGSTHTQFRPYINVSEVSLAL